MPSQYRTPSSSVPDQVLQDAWQEFQELLHGQGARVTETRRIVLARALTRPDHFTADELAADLSCGAERVSRGTVYRTLALLVQAGFLREIRDADTHVHYESVFVREDHEHMICDRCGCFIEFQDTGLAKRVEKACRHRNFQPRSIRVAVFGLCPTCQADVE